MVWIGPTAQSIADMGDKERARRLAKAAGVPVLEGSPRFAQGELGGIDAAAEVVLYPLLVKAAAGGGGIGMRRVDGPAKLLENVEATPAPAAQAFGDCPIYLERFIQPARPIDSHI